MEGDVLNISPIVVWVIALSQLLTFGLTIWNLMASGSRANTRRLDDHGQQLTQHDQRLSSLEQEQETLPSQRDFHDLEVSMAKLQGTLDVLTERLRPLEAITDRVQDWMMEQSKK